MKKKYEVHLETFSDGLDSALTMFIYNNDISPDIADKIHAIVINLFQSNYQLHEHIDLRDLKAPDGGSLH